MTSFSSIFSLDPKRFPYTKQITQAKRESRKQLDGVLFFDLVLSEVAQVPNPAKLYPPRSISDLRTLHEAIEKCPVDLLKKQCCLYYILRDWNTHLEYAKKQHIPRNYCNLMESYWLLDNNLYEPALAALTMPGLTPNFATKILQAFGSSDNHNLLVTYVHTLQTALDTDIKVELYLDALMRLDIGRAIIYSRTLPEPVRHRSFTTIIDFAKSTHDGATVIVDFPFDGDETAWLYNNLSNSPGLGLEALVLRLTTLGQSTEVLKLRQSNGGGRSDLTRGIRISSSIVELKIANS